MIRYKKKWNEGLKLENMEDHAKKNETKVKVYHKSFGG